MGIDQQIATTIDLARAITAGRRTPGDAEQLVEHGALLSRHFSDAWRPRQENAISGDTAGTALMRRTGMSALVVHAEAVRTACLGSRWADPERYLRSLRLGVLPGWPLPGDPDTQTVVYSLRMPVAPLWLAIAAGDAAEADRQAARLAERSRWIGARSLGD